MLSDLELAILSCNYMELIQKDKSHIINELLTYSFVSPHHIKHLDFFTPCGLACECGSLNTLKVLYEHGAELDVYDSHSIPPLHAAIRGGKNHIVEWLLGKKVDVNCCYGGYYLKGIRVLRMNAIGLAAIVSDLNLISLLLEAKVDLSELVKIKIGNITYSFVTSGFVESYMNRHQFISSPKITNKFFSNSTCIKKQTSYLG